MRRNEASFFVFIASIIVGLLISFNLGIDNSSKRVLLNAKQYQDAYNQKNNLLKDISDLNSKNKELEDKIFNYKYGSVDNYKVVEDMNNELENNNMEIGKQAVEGEGIVVTLKDITSYNDLSIVDSKDYTARLIHDNDVIQMINDFKNGGAEAISINGQRIIDRSDIYCGGSYISINGVKCPAPYIISAIGSSDVLKNYLELPQSYSNFLKVRHIDVTIESKAKVKVPAYNGTIKKQYLNKK